MELDKILTPRLIVYPLSAETKEEVISILVERLHDEGLISNPEAAYQAVIERSGLVFRVIRDGAGVNDHVTETALDQYAMPEIDNNGSLEDLEHRVASVVSSLGGYAA